MLLKRKGVSLEPGATSGGTNRFLDGKARARFFARQKAAGSAESRRLSHVESIDPKFLVAPTFCSSWAALTLSMLRMTRLGHHSERRRA